MSKAKPKPSENDGMVRVELNPASGVDVLGDGPKPLLVAGTPGDFTPTEADALLTLRNDHGTPVCRTVRGA